MDDLGAIFAQVSAGETAAQRRLVDAVRSLVDRIEIVPKRQEHRGSIDLVFYGALARFIGGEE